MPLPIPRRPDVAYCYCKYQNVLQIVLVVMEVVGANQRGNLFRQFRQKAEVSVQEQVQEQGANNIHFVPWLWLWLWLWLRLRVRLRLRLPGETFNNTKCLFPFPYNIVWGQDSGSRHSSRRWANESVPGCMWTVRGLMEQGRARQGKKAKQSRAEHSEGADPIRQRQTHS